MKTNILKSIVIIAAAGGTLLFGPLPSVAGDTNAPAAALVATTNAQPAIPDVRLVDQAELVRQIGEEAARDFDPLSHARSLRSQIDALITGTSGAAVTSAPFDPPARNVDTTPAAPAAPIIVSAKETPADIQALQQAIRDLNARLNDVQARLQKIEQKAN
jgi:hypothetical protein